MGHAKGKDAERKGNPKTNKRHEPPMEKTDDGKQRQPKERIYSSGKWNA